MNIDEEVAGAVQSGDKLSAIDQCKEVVSKLYYFRDHYYEGRDLNNVKASQKTDDVEDELLKTLEILDQCQGRIGPADQSLYLMLRGKALSVLPSHNDEALGLLSKAAKRSPNLSEAWTLLGECYWRNKQLKDAKNCFVGALSHGKDKVALRNLSMVLRQLGETSEERQRNIEESVTKAKEALQLDLADGTSWLILGNAYLNVFFSANQKQKSLKQCMSAYAHAEKDVVTANNPDLHFNRATAYKYQELYEASLVDFERAQLLDAEWREAGIKGQELHKYLAKVEELVNAKGKLKTKKLQSMLQTLSAADLGPYAEGSYTSPHGLSIKLALKPLSELNAGLNLETVVLGRVVCSLTSDDPIPLTFCVVDKQGTCVAVNAYNLSQGHGFKVGDTVAIPEPYLTKHDIKHNNKHYAFPSIRVEYPVVFVVNRRKLGGASVAPAMLSVTAMTD